MGGKVKNKSPKLWDFFLKAYMDTSQKRILRIFSV